MKFWKFSLCVFSPLFKKLISSSLAGGSQYPPPPVFSQNRKRSHIRLFHLMGCFYFSFHWLTITSSTHLHLRSSQLSVSKGMSASDKGWGIWRQGRTDWNHFLVGKGGLILHFGSRCNWPVGRFRTFLLYLPGDEETVGRDRQRLGPGLLVDLGPWFPVPSLASPRPLPFTGSILMSCLSLSPHLPLLPHLSHLSGSSSLSPKIARSTYADCRQRLFWLMVGSSRHIIH